ncbi:hypothetical protein Pcac1_g18782 [Phytophthora cactorum]|nr:hypothetical protein Pcac1_g18782 [Phytophthora cactorum]KAG2825131.1 hypothetical protein PC111_g9516 [Phytophthora cactorum]KAG2835155.1 hypothetical protein PC112_g5811 [Phytophthora cactorum]KAG3170510.1 hypothetical protein C6341_g10781 [Phytophthora cactorum]
MASTVSLFAATEVAAIRCLTQVQAHGYMLIPLTEFKGAATGAWIVQIAPQFQANWESVVNDDELIALYVEKVKEAGYANNIRKRLDSDTNLYGVSVVSPTLTLSRRTLHRMARLPLSVGSLTTVHARSGLTTRWRFTTTTRLYVPFLLVGVPGKHECQIRLADIRTASLCRRSNQYCRYRDRQGDPVGGHKPDDHVVEGDTGSTNPHYEFFSTTGTTVNNLRAEVPMAGTLATNAPEAVTQTAPDVSQWTPASKTCGSGKTWNAPATQVPPTNVQTPMANNAPV